MKKLMMLMVICLMVSMNVFAEKSDAENSKEKDWKKIRDRKLKKIERRLTRLTAYKTCLTGVDSRESLIKCRTEKRKARKKDKK